MKKPQTKIQKRRLLKMNRYLDPARLEFRRDGGTYRYVFTRDGKRHRKTLGSDLETAYEAALVLREKHLHEKPQTQERDISLGEWYEQCLRPQREKQLAQTTMDIEKFYWGELGSTIRNTPLHQLTQMDIDRELENIKAPSQRDHTAIFIRTILNAAVKEGRLEKSPFHYIRRKKTKKNVPTLSQGQLVLLCRTLPAYARPAVLLAGFCGLRRGEIMAIQYEDVSLETMQVHVHKAKVIVEGMEHIVEPKAGSSRVVPVMPDVPPTAIEMMTDVFTGQPPEEFIYPIFKSKIHNTIKRACTRNGLPLVGLHDLRHVCGTHWVINHGIAFASAALGHSSIQMTVDVYTDLSAVLQARKQGCGGGHSLAPQASLLARELVEHNDPNVRELALLTLQICG